MLCVYNDDSKFNKIFTYKKETTKLGYDVYLKYDKQDNECVEISYLTSHMIEDGKKVCEYGDTDPNCMKFVIILKYSIHKGQQYYPNEFFKEELIRERCGHVLNEFFYYLLPGKDKHYFFLHANEKDPLDGIANFADNPEFKNGGYNYFTPYKNDFIYDLRDDTNYDKSIELFDGELVGGLKNTKIKEMVYKISDMLMESISNTDENIYNGIVSFTNGFFEKFDVWYDLSVFKVRKTSYHTKWDNLYNRWMYACVIEYKNIHTNEMGKIDFGFNYYNGNLYEKATDWQIQHIIDIYKKIEDQYLKYVIFSKFINKHIKDVSLLASTQFSSFIDILVYRKFPVAYIDVVMQILSMDDEKMEDILELYISYAMIPFKDIFYMYSGLLFDIVKYFMDMLMDDPTDRGTHYVLHKLIKPFKIPYLNDKSRITLEYDIAAAKHIFGVDCAIKLLYAYKVTHQKHKKNMLLSQIMKCAGSFEDDYTMQKDTYKNYKTQEILMLCTLISKLSCSLIRNPVITPHWIFDICKFYVQGYTQFGYSWVYNKEKHSVPASKYDINVVISLNLLINKICKSPDERIIYEKSIEIVNHLVGGRSSWVYKNYSKPMKAFAFFLLNADRYNEHILDRYRTLIDKLAVPYPSVCGVMFSGTIKNIVISQMMPLLWQNKLTDTHFDDLELIAKPFSEGKRDKNTYEIVRNKTIAYLNGI
jgi:hypothetical protein